MKVSREKAQENREKVLQTAATLVRERGIDGLGIADLMKAVGLTHGGFYRQFKSKDDLVTQAVRRAFETSHELVVDQMKADSDGPFEGLVRYYVSNAHRDAAGAGCIVAALATDVARNESSGLRTVVEDSVSTYIDDLVTVLPGRNKVAKRKAAFAVLSEMIGALILARVTGERLSSELLTTVLEDLLKRRDNYSKS